MNHRLIPLENEKEWKEALAGIQHSYGHTWEHCNAMKLTTGHDTYLYSYENKDTLIVAPILEREFLGYKDIAKPFGYSGFTGIKFTNTFSKEWKEFTKSKGYVAGYLGIHPVFCKSDLFPQQDVKEYNCAFVLDLKPEVDEILGKMAGNRRRQFNDWHQIKSSLTENRSELETFFQGHYTDFLNRKNAKSYYFFSMETISELFEIETSFAVGAYEAGKIVAATYFAYTKHIGNALYHLSLPGSEHYSASLLWYGARKLKSFGIPAMNFGGGFNGIARFKKRFGTKRYPLKAVRQIYRNDVYEFLCNKENEDPTNKHGFFPAYRKSYVS